MTAPDSGLRIMQAAPENAPAVHAMVRELAVHEGALAAVATDEEGWRELLGDDRVSVLVATVDGEPVGYVSAVRSLHLWSGREVMALDDLYVRAPARDRGIGEALMRELAARCDGLPLRWEVEEGNLAGQRFSVALGARLRRKVVAWWHPGVW
jgi:GNAT superfamily N-acetyltransferase